MICVGIDIGSFSVKIVEITTSSKTYTITRFQEFPLSTDTSKDKKIEVLDALRQIGSSYDHEQTRFIFAVRQEHVSLRLRSFPFRERHKILRSVAFELEDDIPFSQEDAIFDAQITRYVGNSADVIAMACPKQHVKDLIQLAHDAGIEPTLVSVEGVAFANLLERWQDAPPTQAALAPTPEARPAEMLLDLGHSRAILSVISEGGLITTRTIDWGGRHLAEAIAAKYGLHYVEALKELQKKAFLLLSHEGATRDQIAFSDVLKKALEPLAHEVRLTMLEVSTARNLRFTGVHLTGGTSQIKNLAPLLTQKWEVAVNRLKHFANYPAIAFEPNPSIEAISPMAIAITIEGLRRAKNPAANLRKNEFAPRSETLKLLWSKWAFTAQMMAATFAMLIVYGFLRETFAVDMAAQSLDFLKSQAEAVANLKGRQASPSNVRKYVNSKNEEIKARKLAVGVKDINSALDILALISQSAPSSAQAVVEIRKFSVDNEFVEVHGEVVKADAIARFRASLENVASDKKVSQISPAIQASAGKQAFAFRLKVDRRRGG